MAALTYQEATTFVASKIVIINCYPGFLFCVIWPFQDLRWHSYVIAFVIINKLVPALQSLLCFVEMNVCVSQLVYTPM